MKKLNRPLALVLCFLLCCAFSCALAERDTSQDAFLVQKSMALTEWMARLAGDEHYTQVLTHSPDMQELAIAMGAQDYSHPDEALLIRVDGNRMLPLLAMEAPVADIDPEILERLARRAIFAVPNMLNGQSGSVAVATSSVLSTGEAYLAPNELVYGQLVFFYYIDQPYCVAVAFSQAGEGIVSGAAYFMEASAYQILQGVTESSEMILMLGALGMGVDRTQLDAQEIQALLEAE